MSKKTQDVCDQLNLDAGESFFATRELEQTRSRTYDKKFGQLKGRTFVPVDNEINAGAESVRYLQYDMFGMAKITSNYEGGFPRAGVAVAEFFTPVRGIVSSYDYSVQDLRAAALAGRPLDQARANAAKRAVEQTIDTIAQTGDSQYGLKGLLNQANPTTYTVEAGSGGDTEWTQSGGPNKTPDEIIYDMAGICDAVETASKENFAANMLLLPLSSWQYVNKTRMGDGSNDTILEHFRRIRPEVQVDKWSALETAGSGSVKRMCAYQRDPEVVLLIIPQEFEQFPPQAEDMHFHVPCHARCGGVVCMYPLAIAYGDGI